MQIAWYLWVILTLLSIIPSLIVATVFIVKIVQIKGDITNINIIINALKDDKAESGKVLSSFDSRLIEVFAEANKANTRFINLEESFKALSNKWNSRERELRKEEKQTIKQEKEESEEVQIDDTSSGDPRFPQLNMFQPVPAAIPANSRKFGQMPR